MDPTTTRGCGALSLPDRTVRWRVWAPKARQVDLVVTDDSRRRSVAMMAEVGGYFHHTEPGAGVAHGQRYVYCLDGGPERPDPASLWQPDGVHGPSAVGRPERHAWSDGGWRGVPPEALVFYELHGGPFTPEGSFYPALPRPRPPRLLAA